jgi:excisionase family DNA binding protein
MESKSSTINIAVPVTSLEDWIQSRIDQALEKFVKVDAPPKEYVSQKELCQRIGLSAPTVIDLRKKGVISGVHIGNKWRFEVSEVWEQLRDHQARQAAKFTPIKRNGRA